MNILYADESGDPGISEYGSKHFILSGLIVSQDDWPVYLSRLKQLKIEYPKGSLKKYGLQHYFKMLEPLLLKQASRNDEFGIVRK
jgi:hypothetical protein